MRSKQQLLELVVADPTVAVDVHMLVQLVPAPRPGVGLPQQGRERGQLEGRQAG